MSTLTLSGATATAKFELGHDRAISYRRTRRFLTGSLPTVFLLTSASTVFLLTSASQERSLRRPQSQVGRRWLIDQVSKGRVGCRLVAQGRIPGWNTTALHPYADILSRAIEVALVPIADFRSIAAQSTSVIAAVLQGYSKDGGFFFHAPDRPILKPSL